MDSEPRRNFKQQCLRSAFETHIVHTRACIDRNDSFDDGKNGQKEGYRHNSARFCNADVRNGYNVRRCCRACGCSRLPQHVHNVQKSAFRNACGCGADGDNPKLIGLRRHFAGVDRHGTGILRRGDSDHHGTKHRNLHNGDHILFRSQQERKACRNRASFVQRYRHGGLAIVSYVFKPLLFDTAASYFGIAVAHSLFNILCTALLFPAAPLLEKIAVRLVPDGNKKDTISELDDRLLATPAIALEQCERMVETMAEETAEAFKLSMDMLTNYDADSAGKIRKAEDNSDHLEDIIGTYLTKLSRNQLTEDDSAEVSKLLKAIGDFERISDHSVNILESAEELRSKKIEFTGRAKAELGVLCSAVSEILTAACAAFRDNDSEKALKIEPLEQVIDDLKVQLRDRHIARLKNGECTVEAGFIWSDILTNLERASDHCSNIALCVIDAGKHNMNMHESLSEMKKDNPAFEDEFDMYTRKYRITG